MAHQSRQISLPDPSSIHTTSQTNSYKKGNSSKQIKQRNTFSPQDKDIYINMIFYVVGLMQSIGGYLLRRTHVKSMRDRVRRRHTFGPRVASLADTSGGTQTLASPLSSSLLTPRRRRRMPPAKLVRSMAVVSSHTV